jgi:preprotein translocase subunit YajC
LPSGYRKDITMRHRGLIAVCLLAAGLALGLALPVVAQTTQPAAPAGDSGTKLVPLKDTAHPEADSGAKGGAAGAKKTDDANSQGGGNGKPATLDNYLPLILIGGLILMFVLMGRGRRKEQAQRKEMLANLKKGDKIETIGGILGTVIEVKPDEVTVKVDETNNVRMKFSRRAIHVVGGVKAPEEEMDKK